VRARPLLQAALQVTLAAQEQMLPPRLLRLHVRRRPRQAAQQAAQRRTPPSRRLQPQSQSP
jgi:hypothetical protein